MYQGVNTLFKMNKIQKIFLIYSVLLYIGMFSVGYAQKGVAVNGTGAEPHPSSLLDIESTQKGFLPPRMTTAQRDQIASPANGLVIFNTDTDCLNYRVGNQWLVSCAPVLSSLDCEGATHTGSLLLNTAASNVTTSIPYTSLISFPVPDQRIASTGVTGLAAFLNASSLSAGSGNLVFTIIGTPTSSGVAVFQVAIGGRICSFSRTVSAASATITSCNGTDAGTLVEGGPASGVTKTISYTGGNGLPIPLQNSYSSGVTGLLATVNAGNLAVGNGSVTVSITGVPSGTGTATFAPITIGGQTCTITRTVVASSIATLNCAGPTNVGTLVETLPASGVTTSVPYTSGNGGFFSGFSVASQGVTGLTATLESNILANGTGSLVFLITGTPSMAGTASFPISVLGKSCTFTRSVVTGQIAALNCATHTLSNVLEANVSTDGYTVQVPYTGGNGGPYPAQTVTSTGVAGITLTLASGSFISGSGNLTYALSGTPSSVGAAFFALSIGGQSCTLSLGVGCGAVSFTYNGSSVTYGTLGGVNGRCWLDRNLGATQVATASSDANALGHLFQWGRGTDGHQVRTSSTTATLATSDTPGNSSFITSTAALPFDWRNPSNGSLWQGTSGTNNPCPSGFRIPTAAELDAERAAWSTQNASGAFGSSLKWAAGGNRGNDGSAASTAYSGVWASNSITDNTVYASTTFSTAGTTTWTCPEGITAVRVECWGGGGSGGTGNSVNYCNGGGGGAYAQRTLPVTPGVSYTVVVGNGGAGVGQYNRGNTGGDSWFGSSTTVLAKGGFFGDTGGSGGWLANAQKGGSAANSIGTVKWSGGDGGVAVSGGGGSSAGRLQAGTSGSGSTGGIAPTGGGNGGNGGAAGVAPGGGSGGNVGSSANGATGRVVITAFPSSSVLYFDASSSVLMNDYRAKGYAVRCIKD
jgi:hypothetical protein